MQLSNKCKNKSLIVQLSWENENKFAIHWKTNELQKFMSFLPDDEALIANEAVFYEFIGDFLLKSLKSGKLGKNPLLIFYKNSNFY